MVEQERDAFKTAAKNEEVARIAAEGRLPLPKADDEFASPKKTKKVTTTKAAKESRVSLSTMDIVSSAASEMEIEELSLKVQWESQRADRAQEMIEFLEAECQMHCCPCSKSTHRASLGSSQRNREGAAEVSEPSEPVELVEPIVQPEEPPAEDVDMNPLPVEETPLALKAPKSKKESRRSTIFCAKEGTFRTMSEQEAEIMEAQKEPEMKLEACSEAGTEPPTPVEVKNPRTYARTPSVDPPSFALMAQERTSLLSLLDAPHGGPQSAPLPSIRSVPTMSNVKLVEEADVQSRESLEPRPHTSAAVYAVTTTTVPIRDETYQPGSSFGEKLRTPSSSSSNASFDLTNPALTPTMTREQALAKIRERRGRARSVAQGTMTSGHKRMADGGDRRDMSAPTRKKSRS